MCRLPSDMMPILKAAGRVLGAIAIALLVWNPEPVFAQGSAIDTITPGQLTVLYFPATPPISFIKDGKPAGMAVDIVEEFARRRHLKTEYRGISGIAGVFPAIANRQYDIAAIVLMRTPEREKVVDFTKAWSFGFLAMLTDKASKANSFADFSGKVVAVQAASVQEKVLKAEYPEISLMSFPELAGALAALNAGKVEGVATGGNFLPPILESFPNLKVALRRPSTVENVFPVRKGNDSLRLAFNDTLRDIVDDGTYLQIFDKWYPGEPQLEAMYALYPGMAKYRAPGVIVTPK